MDLNLLSACLLLDRRHSLAVSRSLPDRADVVVPLVDIASFTPLTTALGLRHGTEELTRLLNTIYDVLIAWASVVGLVAWFDADPCGLAIQTTVQGCCMLDSA